MTKPISSIWLAVTPNSTGELGLCLAFGFGLHPLQGRLETLLGVGHPLVDLGLRINSMPLTRRLSTRVIVVEIGESDSSQPSQPSRLVRFGVMAENVVTIRSTGTTAGETEAKNLAADTYLGRLLRLDGQTVQMLLPEHVIPRDLLASLFPDRPDDADATDRLTAARF